MEKNKNSYFKLEEYSNGFESINYTSKPNLRYKENIVNNFKKDYWIFDNYDVYYMENQNNDFKFNIFLVYGCDDNNDINIVRINDKKLIKSLKGHEMSVDIVKYFYDDRDKKHYLLSADYLKIVILWNITNEYAPIIQIKIQYSQYINNLMIIFELNYIITSTDGTSEKDFIKIHSLNNGKLITNINDTANNETKYLLKWNYNNKYYLVELCNLKILIYDLLNKKLYRNLPFEKKYTIEKYFFSGFITSDNKYLYICSNGGGIYIYNLLKSNLIYRFKIKKTYSFKIALWSTDIKDINDSIKHKNTKNKKISNYLLLSDNNRKGFLCINVSFNSNFINNQVNDFNFQSDINTLYKNGKTIKCFKKIIHPIYGECLLCSGNDSNIDLWINNNKF